MKNIFIVLINVLLLGAHLPLHAAGGVPDAADFPRAEPPRSLPSPVPAEIKQEEKPAYQPSDSDKNIKVVVETFSFSGNESITSEQLSALLSDYEKRAIGLQALNQVTKVITEYYRGNGFFLAQAYLPTQDINKNTVEIAIVEGKLGTLTVLGADDLDQAFMTHMAAYRLMARIL